MPVVAASISAAFSIITMGQRSETFSRTTPAKAAAAAKLENAVSVGAWTLTAFSSFAAAAAFAGVVREKVSDRWPIVIIENAAEILAATTGIVMASYTGVLIGATVIPVWNENIG